MILAVLHKVSGALILERPGSVVVVIAVSGARGGNMALNRQQLKEKIEALPLFEKRRIWVADRVEKADKELADEDIHHFAICEVGKTKPYAFVTPGYKLVQMASVFNPILDNISEEVQGYMVQYEGFAMMKFFPQIQELQTKESKFGLIACNSVDLSSSVIVKFCVLHNDLHITIPMSIAGHRKEHKGNVEQLTKDYIKMVSQVKQVWNKIITQFPQYKIVLDTTPYKDDEKILEFNTLMNRLGIKARMLKKIRKDYELVTAEHKHYTLWDMFVKVLQSVSARQYKSDLHREKNIEKMCQAIFDYSLVLQI